MGKTLSYNHVVHEFERNGCKLLELKYVNAHTKMKYICKCSNQSIITWNNFHKGHRCYQCHGKRKITYDFLVEYFRSYGCELLEKSYSKYNTPMKYRCICGSKSKISWDNFRNGHRCKKCGFKKISGSNSHLWNPDRDSVKLNELIRKKYYAAIRITLKSIAKIKDTKSEQLLGFTANDLKNHLASHPNWTFLKEGKWSIDHIFPIKAFLDHDVTDPKIINCLDNLRPLSVSENSSKADNYDEKQFIQWLSNKWPRTNYVKEEECLS